MLASSQIGISLLYFFCQADCRGIVVFSFYNILTQHLAHKNSIRLIAYYLFIYLLPKVRFGHFQIQPIKLFGYAPNVSF